ncbi:hypothetical protein BLA29_011123 [Euroglyphus maynei]|uniref:Uncharacterized protein n=1 Tax=Euroglyphus maynei TaxID=6958 RepID=A0A1Y3B6I4_EURMA|nr:hypothetical protein BLA29_011123 [Euroglyphus maynei]
MTNLVLNIEKFKIHSEKLMGKNIVSYLFNVYIYLLCAWMNYFLFIQSLRDIKSKKKKNQTEKVMKYPMQWNAA